MRTLIAGGGTGGHLTPALALAEELRDSEPDGAVLLVGRRGGVAEGLARDAGVPLETIDLHGLDLSSPLSLGGFALRLPRAVREARRLIRRFAPDVAVGAAGYVSVPVVLAANQEGVPVLLLEQNARPGRSTRRLARRAAAVAVTFPESAQRIPGARRVELTGNPIRRAFRRGAPPLGERCRHLLVWGGSQGARRINAALIACIGPLLLDHPDLQVAHQCGQLDRDAVLAARAALPPALAGRWEVSAFFADAAARVGWADLVVMRAGGSSLAEVSAMGRPMILVPYPHAGDHQRHNAAPFVRAGAAIVIPDAECDGARLGSELGSLIADPRAWREMAARSGTAARPDATLRVAALLQELAASRVAPDAGAQPALR